MALNSQLLTVQILTKDFQVLILCLSYFVTTVQQKYLKVQMCHNMTCVYYEVPNKPAKHNKQSMWQLDYDMNTVAFSFITFHNSKSPS